jgi:hypothetical protein
VEVGEEIPAVEADLVVLLEAGEEAEVLEAGEAAVRPEVRDKIIQPIKIYSCRN